MIGRRARVAYMPLDTTAALPTFNQLAVRQRIGAGHAVCINRAQPTVIKHSVEFRQTPTLSQNVKGINIYSVSERISFVNENVSFEAFWKANYRVKTAFISARSSCFR